MHLLLVLLATAFAVVPCCPPGAKCCPAPMLAPPLAPQTTKVVVKAADPVPAPIPADLMAAIAACEADKAAVAQAQAQTTAAQTALASVQTQIASAQTAAVQAQAKLTQDAATLAAVLGKLYPITVTPPTPPVNPPGPPVDPPKPTDAVVLLEVSRTDCGACNLMDPVLEKLKAGGYVVSRVDCDKDSTAADKWKPERYPTFIMLLDGKENSRTTGMQTYDNLKSWLDGLKKFVLERGDAP